MLRIFTALLLFIAAIAIPANAQNKSQAEQKLLDIAKDKTINGMPVRDAGEPPPVVPKNVGDDITVPKTPKVADNGDSFDKDFPYRARVGLWDIYSYFGNFRPVKPSCLLALNVHQNVNFLIVKHIEDKKMLLVVTNQGHC